jgi:hypothetical protein
VAHLYIADQLMAQRTARDGGKQRGHRWAPAFKRQEETPEPKAAQSCHDLEGQAVASPALSRAAGSFIGSEGAVSLAAGYPRK